MATLLRMPGSWLRYSKHSRATLSMVVLPLPLLQGCGTIIRGFVLQTEFMFADGQFGPVRARLFGKREFVSTICMRLRHANAVLFS